MSRRSLALAAAAPGNAALAAILWMIGAAFFFSILSATIRHLTGELHPLQIAFFRNLFGLAFMLPWLARAGLGSLRTGRFGLYLWRTIIGLMSMFTWFWALALLPFAEAVALSFTTTPLFATMGAALVLKERVRLRRWSATLLGFFGVLVILRPGPAEALNIGAILVIVSCALSGATTLMVKDLLRTESSNAVVTYMVLLMTPISLAPALFVWSWPEPWTWAILIGMGLVATIGHICITHSYKLAEASAVLPYDYTRMIFAAAIGYLWFAEIPDLWTWVGAGIIAASAIYIAHREALYGQASASQSATGPAAMPPARPVPADERRD
jgi:drug/metabolite transporter (DMT)-like permease